MRWHVDTSPLGSSRNVAAAAVETPTVTVEADSWQRALQLVRTSRGERSPISGFSIDMLSDGKFRATDPIRRMTYLVQNAPEDAPLTELPVPPAAGSTPSILSAPPVFPAIATKPFEPMVPMATASSTLVDARPPPTDLPLDVSSPSLADADASAPLAALSGPPDEEQTVPLHAALDPDATDETDASDETTSTLPLPVATATEPVVLFRREQSPSPAAPLHYREYVLALPSGTSEDEAEAILRTELARIQMDLRDQPSGKLVNLAAFDELFTGPPNKLPLVTLTWKDWRGDPMIDRPRRRGTALPVQPMSFPPPPAPAPSSPSVVPAPAKSSPSVAPPLPPAARSQPSVVPPPAILSEPSITEMPIESESEPTGQFVQSAPSEQPEHTAPAEPAEQAAQAAPTEDPSPIDPAPPAEQPVHAQPAEETVDVIPPPPRPMRPDTIPPDTTPGERAVPLTSALPPMRKKADSLLPLLFEAMHDLAFLRDAVEGAYFCLTLALQELPAAGGIVHLYDMERRVFEAIAVKGPSVQALLNTITPDGDPRFRTAAREGVSRGQSAYPPAMSKSGNAANPTQEGDSILAPIVKDGRYLGAIELVGSTDGAPLGDDETNALTYIAGQYAEFVGTRGIIFSKLPRHTASNRPRSPGT